MIDTSEGIIEISNTVFAEILGIDNSFLIGKKIGVIIPEYNYPAKKTEELYFHRHQKTVKLKTIFSENDITGSILFVIISVVADQDKEKTNFLNEAFRTILDNIDEGVLIVDSEGKLVYSNEVQLRFDGQDFESIDGRYSWDVYNLHMEDSTLFKCLKHEKPSETYVHYYITKAGEYVRVTGNNFPVQLEGKTIGAVAIDRNLRKSEDMVAKVVELQKRLYEGRLDIDGAMARSSANKKRFFSFEDILGESDPICKSINQAKNAARSDSPVFLYGETGTGKEMFAQSIHNASARNLHPMISINCAAIPENLLEGIIFGTVKGVFTGSTDRKGLFEEADGGTLFLDEINSMSIHLQSKLLRALEEMKIMRLGGKDEIPVNVRIISSCNINPQMAVAQNLIRSDLFFRLAVIEIETPPLRGRKEDIRILTEFFVRRFNLKLGKNVLEISPESIRKLQQYNWPGNVRQLKHWVESAITMIPEDETILTEKYAPHNFNYFIPSESDMSFNIHAENVNRRKAEVFEEIHDQKIARLIQVLKQHDGNITKAAKEMGISRQGLQYRLQKLGIKTK